MTRTEAIEAGKELGAHHADRATHRWIPRQRKDHTWEVVKIAMPPGARVDPLKETTEAVPNPPQPDDPRPFIQQNTPGAWG